MKLYNSILTRVFTNCNFYVINLWYLENKNKIEKNFYNFDILMSGTLRQRDKDVLEILYLEYYAEKELDLTYILEIYNIGEKPFPQYEEFAEYCQKKAETDIIKKIIAFIAEPSQNPMITYDFYNSECKKINAEFIMPFSKNILYKNNTHVKKRDIMQKPIFENELSFVGKYYPVMCQDFKEMLCYKVLEKILGSNDMNGMYFQFREKGWIYTGLSGYIIENNFFYTGTIMQYNYERETTIIKAIETFRFSAENFAEAKNLVLDDYKYSVLQYGEIFALLPYRLQLFNINVSDFELCVRNITEDEIKLKLRQLCKQGYNVRMKVV